MIDDNTVTAVQYGVGPIGQQIIDAATQKGIRVIGGIDVDPEKVGKTIDELCQISTEESATVSDDSETVLSESPSIVFHSTVSSIEDSEPQIVEILEAGCNVISTCEELSYPKQSNHEVADRIDEIAKENGVTCLSTGINPGFVMDTLPVVLSTPVNRLDSIHVTRIQDAQQRRVPLQQKIGAGLTVDEFDENIAGGAGHVGSRESIEMLADGLDWSLTDVSEEIKPITADKQVDAHVDVKPDDVAGVSQTVRGTTSTGKAIGLNLLMYVGAENPKDEIRLEGSQDLTVTVDGGYHGDYSTSAIVTNLVDNVRRSDPGLQTMLDITTPSYRATCRE